jgi:hypothetical protein
MAHHHTTQGCGPHGPSVSSIFTRVCDLCLRSRQKNEEKEIVRLRGGGSTAGLQPRVRVVPAALLAMLGTALALWPDATAARDGNAK